MDTYYKMTYVSMLALNNGNLLIMYSKSDSGQNNLQLGTVTESTPNAYFMVLDKNGQKVTGQTRLNTFSAASLPQLTRFVSAAELSNGDIAFFPGNEMTIKARLPVCSLLRAYRCQAKPCW
ncbi:hypothetical protein ACFTAO_02495 [Paenibacillus rhizoplanae]